MEPPMGLSTARPRGPSEAAGIFAYRGPLRLWRSRAAGRRRLCHKRLGQNLSYILDRKMILGVNRFDSILKHGYTEWTSGRHRLGPSIQRLLNPCAVDPLADLFFHPGPAASAAATEGPVTAPAHFSDTVAVHGTENLARRIVDIVPASKKAGIMVGQPPFVEICWHL